MATQVWLHTYATDGVTPSLARYVLQEFTPANFLSLLARTDAQVLVAESGNALLAYATLAFQAARPDGRQGTELATLYVQEHFTGAGLGSMLLGQCRQIAQSRSGDAEIWLTVNARNRRAMDFYRKHGFVRNGTSYFELDGEKHENHVLIG
ncbi:GNAT family N-acetyltransferase [Chitinimonas arctica]|uniref:GNAT family N-acetyltransferase n=1 Tax=Chitinimonas arctica TaxID=2594795 RepID=A0A516SMJ2_9NEIS|nr:GNAT family N-acetyltransferase [Chitinimonas arctica]